MKKLLILCLLALLAAAHMEAMPSTINPGRHDRLHHRAGNRWGKFRPTRCRFCRRNATRYATLFTKSAFKG